MDLDAQRKGKAVVLKTSTRQTIFLPVIGLVDADELAVSGDWFWCTLDIVDKQRDECWTSLLVLIALYWLTSRLVVYCFSISVCPLR